jgi:hypothetical protein
MDTDPDAAWADRTANSILLIRILVGWVFLSEGIQKFLFPDALGVGSLVKIGIPRSLGSLRRRGRNCLRVTSLDRP